MIGSLLEGFCEMLGLPKSHANLILAMGVIRYAHIDRGTGC